MTGLTEAAHTASVISYGFLRADLHPRRPTPFPLSRIRSRNVFMKRQMDGYEG